jgi:DNA-binding NtrC family response regulator
MRAQGGSLFIDEFASLSHDLQVNFLSVLEKRSVQKVGGESFTANVRCIFATNADIEKLTADGVLRRDLLDRIPARFRIPPLRERGCDVFQLARHFAGNHEIAPKCLLALLRYNWPGNVRELKSRVDSALARMKTEGLTTLEIRHFDFPGEAAFDAEGTDDEACRRELWMLADASARNEGFEHGAGLQRRAGEIMGVSEGQASKMYQTYGLARAASA